MKLKFFKNIVMSVSMYGWESWKGLREVEDRVRRFESDCLRKIMKIRWYDMVSEEELKARTRQKSVIERLRMCCWRWYGHIQRIPQKRIPKEALYWRPAGSRRVGRPKDTWRNERTLDRVYVEALAGDRVAWKNFIAALWIT